MSTAAKSQNGGSRAVEQMLDDLSEASTGATVRIGEITEAFGSRGLGPFLLIPALFEITPIGAIPGLPTILAVILLLFSAQVAIGRDHLWLPQAVENRRVKASRFRTAADKLRPTARWMDKWFHGRLSVLTSPVFVRLAGLACMGMTFLVPPLEIVPFATTLPMGTIAMFGLALLVRDGALMLAGFLLASIAIGTAVYLLFF